MSLNGSIVQEVNVLALQSVLRRASSEPVNVLALQSVLRRASSEPVIFLQSYKKIPEQAQTCRVFFVFVKTTA